MFSDDQKIFLKIFIFWCIWRLFIICFLFYDIMHRYRTSLQQSVEREKLLERSKAQVELDWQCHCEELERRQYSKSEALIASLSQSKDQVF